MTQEFMTLPRDVVERALECLEDNISYDFSGNPYEEGDELMQTAAANLRAALEQPVAGIPASVLAGWKLAPVAPTREMLAAACRDGVELNGRPVWKHTVDVQAAWRWGQMLDAAPQPPVVEQPQAEQPTMTPIAQRKLEDLMASGYTISGYSIYHEQKHQHGFVTGAGLVGWWKPEGVEYPQPQGDQEPRCLAGGARYKVTHLTNAGYCIHGLPREMLGQWVAFVDATDNKHMANQQPRREPLTDEQIDAPLPTRCRAAWRDS